MTRTSLNAVHRAMRMAQVMVTGQLFINSPPTNLNPQPVVQRMRARLQIEIDVLRYVSTESFAQKSSCALSTVLSTSSLMFRCEILRMSKSIA